jgi:hypothetical protein
VRLASSHRGAGAPSVLAPENTLSGIRAAIAHGADLVEMDVRELLSGIDMISPVYDPMTFEVIGEGPGVECHSSPMQQDCSTIFGNVGLDMTTGDAVGASAAFYRR